MKLETLTKKQIKHSTMYQCKNEKCSIQFVAIQHFIMCPICCNGSIEIISSELPF